jgi:tRNA modification GTPase
VKRSRASIENADLILLLLDVTIPLSKEDKILIEAVKEKKIILVLNKIDLPSKINLKELKTQFKNKKFIQISALKMQGLEKLEAAILEMVWQGEIAAANQILVSNVRHIDLFRKTYASVEKSISIIKDRLSLEFVAEYVKEALDYLGQITGKNTSEDLLEKIFREFCIGK